MVASAMAAIVKVFMVIKSEARITG